MVLTNPFVLKNYRFSINNTSYNLDVIEGLGIKLIVLTLIILLGYSIVGYYIEMSLILLIILVLNIQIYIYIYNRDF